MKKSTATKGVRWGATVLTLLLLLLMVAALLPSVSAKYVGGAEEIETGISGVSDADLTALLVLMMEERFPVGSIYMTTTAGGYPSVGMWEILEDDSGISVAGKTLVGVWKGGDAGDVIQEGDVRKSGGSLGGGTNNATATLGGAVSGDIALTSGKANVNNDGGLVFGSGCGVTLWGSSLTVDHYLTIAQMPAHTHSGTMYGYVRNKNQPTNNKGKTLIGSGSTRTYPQYDIDDGQAAGYRWNIGPTGINTTSYAPVKVTTDFDLSLLTATLHLPTINYTRPTVSYSPLALELDVTAYDEVQTTVTDTTVQPYEACYIYQRVS